MTNLTYNKGFSLVEVMIAIVIGMILISAVSATYVVQNRSHTTQESVSEVNTQSKIANDLISNDIKGTGYGTPADLSATPANGSTTIVVPFDSSSGPDAVTIVGGFNEVGEVWPIGLSPSSNISCASTNKNKYIRIGTNTFDIILTGEQEPAANMLMTLDSVEFIQLANAVTTGDTTRATLVDNLSKSIGPEDTTGDLFCDKGRPIYFVEGITYCVDIDSVLHRITGSADAVNCQGTGTFTDDVIAENIEDLQFAYAIESDPDDDNPMDIDASGNVLFYDSVASPIQIRAMRINVLARADRPDHSFKDKGAPPDVIENHDITDTIDDFRRRWWITTVRLRNQ